MCVSRRSCGSDDEVNMDGIAQSFFNTSAFVWLLWRVTIEYSVLSVTSSASFKRNR